MTGVPRRRRYPYQPIVVRWHVTQADEQRSWWAYHGQPWVLHATLTLTAPLSSIQGADTP